MDTSFFVANWKSHKTETEAKEFLDEFSKSIFSPDKIIILCPPATLLQFVKNYIDQKGVKNMEVGAQNISEFGEGAYTGEENARQVSEFAKYVIIGHSERRKLFGENNEIFIKKANFALSNNLTPIFCVENDLSLLQPLSNKNFIVAYEPSSAIGSGTPDDPEHAALMAKKIKEIGNFNVLYGGSVTPENVSSFTKQGDLDGVLIGGGSLSVSEFISIINNG